MLKKMAEKFIWKLVLITNGKQIAERDKTLKAIEEQQNRLNDFIRERGYWIMDGSRMEVLLALTKAKTPEEAKSIVDYAIEGL